MLFTYHPVIENYHTPDARLLQIGHGTALCRIVIISMRHPHKSYIVYTYVGYAFDVRFNPLFLVYAAHRVYAGRGAADILCAADIGGSVNGRVYGTSRPASSYPAGGNFRSFVCRQYRHGDWVFEEPDVVAHPDVIGFHKEHAARRDLTHQWFNALAAPTTRMFTLENAAHAVAFEQFEAFGTIMRETVLPETYRGR